MVAGDAGVAPQPGGPRDRAGGARDLGRPHLLVDVRVVPPRRQGFLNELTAGLAGAGRAPQVTRATTADLGTAAAGALAAGDRYLVAVGDDRSVAETVNGLFADGVALAPEAVLGVAEVERHRDISRTYGLDRPAATLAQHLATDLVLDIDVGMVTYRAPGGETASRLFLNVAQVGYGADLVRRAARLRLLGRAGALLGAYAAIRAVPRQEAAVEVDHTTARARLVNLVVANGQFYAEGSKIAPRGLPDDGRFNVQLFSGERSQVFLLTTPIFRGEHLPDPAISEYQSATVRIAPATPVPVEADGQHLGTTPATFSVLPKALRLKI